MRDMDKLERIQQRTKKMIQELEHFWGERNTDIGCPGRWWSLPLEDNQKLPVHSPGHPASKCPWLSKDVGPDDLQSLPSTSTTLFLWFTTGEKTIPWKLANIKKLEQIQLNLLRYTHTQTLCSLTGKRCKSQEYTKLTKSGVRLK